MLSQLFAKKESKKVIYIELVYDLIFVYIIGRNNALLHHAEGGFIPFGTFFYYAICTLAVIQIWNYSTYYMNVYGRNSSRDHIFLFLNMFMMYSLAQGTRTDWQNYHTRYHIMWALILINIAVQYIIEYRHHTGDELHTGRIKRTVTILLIEAVIILAAILEFNERGSSYCSAVAIVFGLIATAASSKMGCCHIVDFDHLTERAMLYVVFTFGEMIIAISVYFEEDISVSNFYYAAMTFLIVVGLFLSYGRLFDHIVDRHKKTNGMLYIFLHIFIVFALNNVTVALEFMQNNHVDTYAKILFIAISLLIYFAFLFALTRFARKRYHFSVGFYFIMLAIAASFCALMILFHEMPAVNIAITVVYVYAVYFILRFSGKRIVAHAEGSDNAAIDDDDDEDVDHDILD
jgi:low temperature requirement protein LtrA